MDRNIRQLANEIKAGKNSEQTLPLLMSRMASAYGQLSFYNLAIELSMFLESAKEGMIKPDKMVKDMHETIQGAVAEEVESGYDPNRHQEVLEQMISLRDKVTERMEILTAYTDLFIQYEYVINRLEPKFLEAKSMEIDDDTVAREILQWIFSEEEHALINEKIKMMLANLPIRMTKGKLVELIENAFSLYQTADAQSVETFDYMLRSAAGMYQPKGMAKTYPKLQKVRKLFEEKDFSTIAKEDFLECRQQLLEQSEVIQEQAEALGGVQAILNAFLTVLLTRPYFTLEAEKKSERMREIIQRLLQEETDTENLFSGIENEMEKLSEEVNSLEPLFSYVEENAEKQISELMLTTVYQRLKVVQRLNSGSVYAELVEKEKKETPVGYTEKMKNCFVEDIKAALEKGSKLQNRAVMAAVLRELPVYFNSHTEVMNYVRGALEQCHDEAEKIISVELLRSCYE